MELTRKKYSYYNKSLYNKEILVLKELLKSYERYCVLVSKRKGSEKIEVTPLINAYSNPIDLHELQKASKYIYEDNQWQQLPINYKSGEEIPSKLEFFQTEEILNYNKEDIKYHNPYREPRFISKDENLVNVVAITR